MVRKSFRRSSASRQLLYAERNPRNKQLRDPIEPESSPFNKRNPLRRLHQWYFQKYFQTSLRGAGVLLISSILIFILPIPPPVQDWNSKAWKNSVFELPSSGGPLQTILPMLSSLRNFSQTQQHPKLLLLYWKGKPKQKEKKSVEKKIKN